MKMHFTRAMGVCCTLALFFLTSVGANAQCLSGGSFGTITPVCDGSGTAQGGSWTDEYSTVNVVEDEEYIFTSSVPSHYITVSNATGTTALAFGTGPVVWTSDITGTVRFYTHLSDACNGENVGHDRIVTCGEQDCPAIFANIGDPCDDDDPLTFGDAITEDCECEGQLGGPGDSCGDPIVIESLPFTATDNTINYANSVETMPTATTYPAISNGTGSGLYISGPEAVYEYTAAATGGLEITLDNVVGWTGLIVLKECPFTERLAYSTSTVGGSRSISQLPVEAGETLYIVVSTWETQTANTPYEITVEEFVFDCPALSANIGEACDDGDPNTINDLITENCECVGTLLGAGASCNDPIVVDILPYTTEDNTANYEDTYSNTDMPAGVTYPDISTGFQSGFYLNGDDAVYEYTAAVDGGLEITLEGIDTWVGLYIFKDCPFTETLAYDIQTGAGTRNIEALPVVAGETIYVVISTNPLPQSTAYTLTIEEFFFDCPALSADIGDLCDDDNPETINDVINENCECQGAILGAGASCDDPIFVESLPYNTTDNTANYDDTYSNTDMPAGVTYPDISNGAQSAFYLNGDDAVYEYVVTADGGLEITLENIDTWVGLYVFKGCPFTETLAYDIQTGAGTRSIQGLPVEAGETIYVVISTNPLPQATPYTLTIEEFVFDCPEFDGNIGDPCDDGDIFTINTTVDENCGCTGGLTLPAGASCFSPVNVTALPFSLTSNTENFLNIYGSADLPAGGPLFPNLSTGTGGGTYLNGDDAVFRYIAPANQSLDVTLSDHGTWAGLWVMKGCPDFNQVVAYHTATDGAGRAIEGLPVEAGEMYFFVVSTFPAPQAIDFTLVIEEAEFDCPDLETNVGAPCDDGNPDTFLTTIDDNCECTGGVPVITNETCETAIPIECGSLTSGTTFGAASDNVLFCGTGDGTGGGVWYTVTPDVSGPAVFDLCDTDFDSKIRVYTGSCENFTCVGGNDDSFAQCGAGNASYLATDLTGGETYYILVHGFGGNEGVFTLDLTCGSFDCPDLDANIGDICDADGEFGEVDEDCNCVAAEFAGCTNGSQFLTGDVNCDNAGTGFYQATGSWVNEYTTLNNASVDQEFTFSTPDHTGDIDVFYVTITDVNDVILDAGIAPFDWTSTVDGTIRFYTHGTPTCTGGITGGASSHTRRVDWVCSGFAFDCPDLEANIGDECDDDDPTTINTVVTDDCECVGTSLAGGASCAEPIIVGDLPYVTTDNTENYDDVYSSTDLPVGVTFPDISNGSGSGLYLNGDDAVYEYTATADGALEISLDSIGTWVGLWVFKGCPFDETLAYDIQSGAGTRNIAGLPVTAGETIYVVISTWPTPQTTPYTLTIEGFLFDCPDLEANIGDACDDGDPGTNGSTVDEDCECTGGIPTADNQTCETAVDIECGSLTEGSTIGASNDDLPFCGTGNGTGGGVWYTFTPTESGLATFDLCDTDFDSKIRVYTGSCGDFTCVGGNDDLSAECGTGGASYLETEVSADETYYVLVHGFGANEGIFTLDLTCDAFDCQDEEANIGDACDADGEFGELNENCECVTAVFSGCTTGSSFATRDVNCDTEASGSQTITGSWVQEYNTINNASIDQEFTFSITGHTGDIDEFYVTVADTDNSILAFGVAPFDWTSTVEGTFRLFVHGAPNCAGTITGGASSHTRQIDWTCADLTFDCPDLEANFGDECDDGDAGTIGSTVDENCECTGGVPTSENQTCENAVVIECGSLTSGSTIGASNDDLPFCGTNNGTGGGVWFTFTPDASGFATFDLCDTDFDSKIRVFSGSCDDLTCVDGNDDSFTNCGSGGASYLEAEVSADETYYVLVHGFSDNEGDFTLELTCDAFDCQDLEANIGDACDADGDFGEVDADCECVPAVFAGCTNGNSFGTIDASCDDESEGFDEVTNSWVNEYSTVNNVSAGQEFTFSVNNHTGDIETFYVTITDVNDSIIDFGTAPYDWTSNVDGTIRFYTHSSPTCEGGITGSASAHARGVDWTCPPAGCTADGGTLTALTTTSLCVGTGSDQTVDVEVSGASGTNARWGLLDSNGNILDSRVNNSLFDLDDYAPGTYRIHYIRYEDDVNLAGVSTVGQVLNLEGCWDAASNQIFITLSDAPEAGVLSATSPTTVCKGEGAATSISVEITDATGDNSAFGLVDINAPGNPIVAAQFSPTFNLNPYPAGTYQVRHLAYQNGTVVSPNTQFESDIEGCFAISNPVTVTLANCEGIELGSSPNPTAGPSFVTFTNPVEEMSTLEVYDMSGRLVRTLFRQVTNPGQEYRLEFDGGFLPNGVYLYRLTTPSEVVIDKFMIAR
ncbi:MAG: T9SS type A sorting domain-containing protein [Cryomorphaceae bacterium]|nr:T9SS type A sorting domain-containing protein [Flavobacteriales bacterium]